MTMNRWAWAAVAFLPIIPSAHAQEQAEKREPRRTITPLKVQVVFSRYQGEKKVASLPYALTCNAGERMPAVLRMGIEVPIPVPTTKEGTPSILPSIQYKNVGTNIDCKAFAGDDGRFNIDLNVEQSSIYAADEKMASPPVGTAPMFRTFRANFNPILRDGQSFQYTAATDPVNGEVVKIDVSLTVLK